MKIVFNSSPLIFLSRLKLLTKFIDDENNFYLPTGVRAEIESKEDEVAVAVNKLIANKELIVKKINLVSLADRLNDRLGRGESEAIALGIQLQTDYIILDDFAARKEADRLGLSVKGTLAIIRKLQAEEKIKLENLDEFYQNLQEMKFRVSRAVFDGIFGN